VRVLGIETATWTASVAIIDEGLSVAEQYSDSTSHATALLPLVENTLKAADVSLKELDLIAVSIGPGSFTGLRIGLSVAKGLALAQDRPMVGVSTLEALAVAAGPRSHVLWTVLDARKREVYAAAFDCSAADVVEAVYPPTVCAPEQLATRLEPPCVVVGDGVDVYGEIWRAQAGREIELQPAATLRPSGAAVARLGLRRFRTYGADAVDALEPYYVRSSDAERQRNTSV
jgi:tRNA threonylcarbamoyladenosine biosynthesis protein TsaB